MLLRALIIIAITLNIVCVTQVLASDNETTYSKIPFFTLNTGRKIPSIGYETWQENEEELEKDLVVALEAGYRYIGTAYGYDNEKIIGKIVKRWITEGKLKRDDLFLVTKLPPGENRPESVSKYLEKSLENLQVDYVDLYLIHSPISYEEVEGNQHPTAPDDSQIQIDSHTSTNHSAIWKEMEKQMDAGFAKAIGLSNFNKTQIETILKNCKIPPSSLEIELHPYLQQNTLVDFCKKNNIIVKANSPLASSGLKASIEKFGIKVELPLPDILRHPTVETIAKKHSKSETQILLRFDIQRGIIPIPKSTNAESLRQNIDIFDFELDSKDIQDLKSLDPAVRFDNLKIVKEFSGGAGYMSVDIKISPLLIVR